MDVKKIHIGSLYMILLGAFVMIGWHLGIDQLIQVNKDWAPMQYNAALLFVMSGIGYYHKRVLYFVIIISLAVLSQDITGVNLGIDELIMDSNISVQTPSQGRMAIPTSLCFILLSLAIMVKERWSSILLIPIGLASFFSLIGYATNLEVYRWFGQTSMAVLTALGFAGATLFLHLKHLRDRITKQHEQSNDLKSKNEEISKFAYIAAHDLKSPIRGIISLSDWLEEEVEDADLSDDSREYIRLIKSRSKRMHNLIEGILEYSKIERDKNPEFVSLNKIIDQIILDLTKDNVEIIRSNLPDVQFNRHQAEQLFLNLISNAILHNDEDEIRINIGCETLQSHYKFYVLDNGPGIEDKYHEKVFEIFQTLKSKDEYESTGVGLSIVKKIVDNSGGKIWITKNREKGAEFFFTIKK